MAQALPAQAEALRMFRSVWGLTIPERRLAIFFRNFARLVATGLLTSDAIVKASFGFDDELAAICKTIAPRLFDGMPLHQALEPYRLRFPEMTIPVLEVGEVSGTLEDAAARLADAFEKIGGFQEQYNRVALEPGKLIAGAVVFRCLFMAGSDPIAVLYAAVATAVETLILYFLLRLVQRNLYRWPRLHVLVDKIHLAIPHVGSIERSVASARWARSFGTMWHAGVPISLALEVSSRSTLNAYYEQQISRAAILTRQGTGLAASLATMEMTPKHLLPLLAIGEESAKFADALDSFVEALEEEAILKAQQEANAALVIVYLMAGLLMVLIAFGVPNPFSR